jgi:predicted metal-dependent hydrolase
VEDPAITDKNDLPTYTVRISRRAQQVRLVVSLTGGLQVIVPAGFDVRRVPELVRGKLGWVERALGRLRARQEQAAAPRAPIALPDEIALPAASETWRVSYHSDPGMAGVTLRERDGHLVLSGHVQEREVCRTALKRWLAHRARRMFATELAELRRTTGLSYARLSVRGQRSRWGSCSRHGSISLNYKLLFLPPPLVRYVLLHELCHTRQPNHSRDFWALVAQHEPAYRRLRTELRRAGQNVPAWAQ